MIDLLDYTNPLFPVYVFGALGIIAVCELFYHSHMETIDAERREEALHTHDLENYCHAYMNKLDKWDRVFTEHLYLRWFFHSSNNKQDPYDFMSTLCEMVMSTGHCYGNGAPKSAYSTDHVREFTKFIYGRLVEGCPLFLAERFPVKPSEWRHV